MDGFEHIQTKESEKSKTKTKTYKVKNVFDKKSYPTKEANKVLTKVKKIIS
jgi:hypothetical protein